MTTDAKGFFQHIYETDENLTEVQLLRNGDEYLRIYEEDELGWSYYGKTRSIHRMILKVDDSLSINDTLFFSGIRDEYFVGPFKNNQIVTFETGGGSGGMRGLTPGDTEGFSNFYWGLGMEEYNKVRFNPTYQVAPNLITGIPNKACGTGGDVIIDLRGYGN